MEIKARCRIDSFFIITGRGLVMVGKILEGEIHTGDFIEFVIDEKMILRKIKGIEMVRVRNPDMIGLLIATDNEEETRIIRNWDHQNLIAYIYRKSTAD